MTVPGFGSRHPVLTTLLERFTGVTERVTWPGGYQLVLTAYPGCVEDIPDELVTSVRCITTVGGRIVVCRTPEDVHIWPGGRRLAGETFVETAAREVHEETGWRIDPATARRIGLLHYEMVDPMIIDETLPHPDFVQVVLAAEARERDGDADHDWKDTEGWELGSNLVTRDDIASYSLPPTQRAFLHLV